MLGDSGQSSPWVRTYWPIRYFQPLGDRVRDGDRFATVMLDAHTRTHFSNRELMPRSIVSLNAFGENGLRPSMESTLFKLIGEINRRVSTGTDYRRVLDFIFDSLESVIPYDRMGIAILSGEGADLRLKLEWVKSKIHFSHLDLNYSAPVRGSSLEKLLLSNQPRIINDLINYSQAHPTSESTKLALLDGIRSSLTCPLRAGGRSVGVLFFSSARSNTYRDAHVATFLSLAEELSLIVDHGRLRHASEQIVEQSKSLGMLLHDLRSPLGVIQGFVQASFEEPWYQALDAEGKQVFEIILRNSGQMFGLLNELLEVSELNSNADKLLPSEVTLTGFFDEMSHFGTVLAERKQIKFSKSSASDLAQTAKFDKDRIRRVLENLISNAIKFSNRGQSINMSISSADGRLNVSVEDQGQGIAESELPKLFREFGKTSTRPTENETSTGLGLAIAKKIVEQHGGELTVKSLLGQGSTFSFWLPLV